MRYSFSLKIAGISCLVTCNKYNILKKLEIDLKGFKNSNINKNDLYLSINQESASKYKRKAHVNTFFVSNSSFTIYGPSGVCNFNLKAGKGEIFTNCGGKLLINFVRSTLMDIYKHILPIYGAIAMHASSIADRNKGILFAGESGAGKSTIVKLLPSYYKVLNDDLAFVKYKGGLSHMYNSPINSNFRRGINYATRAVIEKIFFLKKDSRNKIYYIPKQIALRKLIRNVYGFGIKHPYCDNIFKTCCNIIDTVPCFILGFRKDMPVSLESYYNMGDK